MRFIDIFRPKLFEDDVLVTVGKSKGPTPMSVSITVGDIKRGMVYDEAGYKNEIVLFLRKNKADK